MKDYEKQHSPAEFKGVLFFCVHSPFFRVNHQFLVLQKPVPGIILNHIRQTI